MTASTEAPGKKVTVNLGGVQETFEFSDRQKVIKKSVIQEGGTVVTRFIFRNGEVRTHSLAPDDALYATAARHGMDQKFGDEFAGENDVEDCILAFEELSAKLAEGKWTDRKTDGIGGSSILLRALIEYRASKGLDADKEVVKGLLKTKTPAQKIAMRAAKELAPIIQRLEEERAAKGKKITPEQADAELSSMLS